MPNAKPVSTRIAPSFRRRQAEESYAHQRARARLAAHLRVNGHAPDPAWSGLLAIVQDIVLYRDTFGDFPRDALSYLLFTNPDIDIPEKS